MDGVLLPTWNFSAANATQLALFIHSLAIAEKRNQIVIERTESNDKYTAPNNELQTIFIDFYGSYSRTYTRMTHRSPLAHIG